MRDATLEHDRCELASIARLNGSRDGPNGDRSEPDRGQEHREVMGAQPC